MSQRLWPLGRLVEVTTDECWRLLEEHQVGRVVWSSAGRPNIVPVNYLVADRRVWLRTAPYSQLGQECSDCTVAFEVDEIDEFTHSGASVVVRGRAQPVRELPNGVDGVEGIETWADGTRSLVLCIEAEEVSGRRLLPS